MKKWILFDPHSGEIKTGMRGTEPMPQELGSLSYIEGQADHKTEYILSDAVITRPTFNLTESPAQFLETESFIVSGVPVGATLAHPDGETVINDGEFEWETLSPGTYNLSLSLFPYLDRSWTLEVTAAPA